MTLICMVKTLHQMVGCGKMVNFSGVLAFRAVVHPWHSILKHHNIELMEFQGALRDVPVDISCK